MNVGIIGVGYVGLVTGSCLARMGNKVICADIDTEKIDKLNQGIMTIYEPGLDEVVKAGLAETTLRFSDQIESTVEESDLIFICVGTPSDESGAADLKYVKEVAKGIAASIHRYKVIINKSTVPVGTTRIVQKIIEENMPHFHEFDVVSNPEFLREGSAVEDFMNPDRIVIGSDSQKAIGLMTELYAPLKAPLVIADSASAEMIKYASNSFLATKVSFINAISNICDNVGADVKKVALGMGYDKRIGFEFLEAGPGFGGSCFPKDCKALIKIAEDSGYDFRLLKGVMEVNEAQQELMVSKLKNLLGGLKEKTIAALGLSFKPNTDDIRESPAICIIKGLLKEGASVKAYDPVSNENAKKILPEIKYEKDAYDAVKGSDGIIILTEWDEFKWLDFEKIKQTVKNPLILDTRNCLDPQLLRKSGYIYQGVGR
ncbi:MAG: UDP-glucose/GDP-mannose dehydrogenase family protein [Actinobacteria bacterium]|nr:UDP-glucose/GDP-mannose dehydrogenase family protein [Actinomycetota bacterium]